MKYYSAYQDDDAAAEDALAAQQRNDPCGWFFAPKVTRRSSLDWK